jgi:hypothetical protein
LGRGQPTKLNDISAQRVIASVKKGLPRDTSAKLAGVAPSTLALWLKKGREGDPVYSDFSERVREAEAHGEAELVGLMRDHSRSSWQACAWLLERRRPQTWGARKYEPPAAAPSVLNATSPEERVSLLESMLAAERSATG